nr:MAG TPA: hypothetical protein [Caudoviricetes sp.]
MNIYTNLAVSTLWFEVKLWGVYIFRKIRSFSREIL